MKKIFGVLVFMIMLYVLLACSGLLPEVLNVFNLNTSLY